MYLQLTKKTNEWLKQKQVDNVEISDVYSWHVNYQYVLGKRFVVLVHDISRFVVVLYGVKKNEMINPDFIFNAIYSSMLAQEFEEDLVLKYIRQIPTEISFGKTKGKALVSAMNQSMSDCLLIASKIGLASNFVEQLHISKIVNDLIVGKNKFQIVFIPKTKMLECLELMFD